MYEVSIRGMVTTPEGSHSVDGGQLKTDIEARRDIFSEGPVEDGERIDVFVPYHAVETAQLRWSALEAADPVDANCGTEESETVLFDGVVTLTEVPDEGVFVGNPEGGLVPTVGERYMVTINGTSKLADAIEMEGASVIFIMPEQGNQIGYGGSSDEPVTFVCTSQYGHAGENTLRVVLSGER